MSALQWILILKRFFVTHGLGPGKPGPRAAKPITPPYVENNYRIEVKITFMLIAYLVLLCEFFWEFSIFQFCRPLVDIYWHPLLRCFNTVFQRLYRYFSIALKVVFSTSDRYKIFTSNWLWIEICENVILSKIDITMITINKKLWNW